jgi:hypothetical protein
MHPKKHQKPHQLKALVLFFIMILCQPVYASDKCNKVVAKMQIHSLFTKGYLRIEGNKVVASRCGSDCSSGDLYKVTIEKHYMLLYHIKSSKFICWNKKFNRLVGKKNPTNLTHCKFEDKVSILYPRYNIRYTTKDDMQKEREVRFNRSGAFARPSLIKKCLKKHKYKNFESADVVKLYESEDMDVYRHLSNHCASSDFMPINHEPCSSGLPDFCSRMKELREDGRIITSEIMDLCRNEWVKRG